jgi:hypothetical protein
LNSSIEIAGCRASRNFSVAKARRSMSPPSAFPIAAMIMPWSSERYESETLPVPTFTESRKPHRS